MNVFDDEEAQFKVLVNAQGQHSLWPSSVEVPAGWTVRLGDSARSACLAHVESEWTDMRPADLVEAMGR